MFKRYHPKAKCENCPLYEYKSFVPAHIPEQELSFLVIGEAPGRQEVIHRRPFVGPSGKVLNIAITKAGQDHHNIGRTNLVACRPPENATPPQEAIDACASRLNEEIYHSRTNKIVLLGKSAGLAILRKYCQETDPERGQWYQSPITSKQFFMTHHPAYILRKVSEAKIFMRDIASAFEEPRPRFTMEDTDPEVVECNTASELYHHLSKCPDHQSVAFDLETNNVHWFGRPGRPSDPVLMAAYAWEHHRGIIVGDELLYNESRTREILHDFSKRVDLCAHNGKFDAIYAKEHLGFRPTIHFDTMLAHYVLDESEQHGLKHLATEYLGMGDYERELITPYLSKEKHYSNIPWHYLAQYAIRDVCATLRLREIFEPELYKQDLYQWPFQNVIMPIQDALTDVQHRGIRVDVEYLHHARTTMEADMERLRTQLQRLGGEPNLNPNSWQQVSRIIYGRLKLPPSTNRKVKKLESTASLALMHLLGHPFIDALFQYRRIHKLKTSYIDVLLEHVSVKGRVHTDFMVMGTEIGRLAARNPALQTIPRPDDEYGALVRNAFCAEEGEELIIADYSQAELRVAAALSGEPFLMRVYEEDRDLHSEGTYAMFGTPTELSQRHDIGLDAAQTLWKKHRSNVKRFNFAYLYGGNEYSFAEDSGLPIAQARQFVREYEANMPRLVAWRAFQYATAKKTGMVESIFGRRRRWALITEQNKDEVRKSSAHFKVSSPASDITLLSLCQMVKEGIDVQLTVHDSNISCAHKSIVADVARRKQQIMLEVAQEHIPEVPWKVDVDISYRWGTKSS